MPRAPSLVVPAALAALASTLCLSCGAPAPASDRRDVLRDLTANVILPTYRDLADRSGDLRRAADALCASPSDDGLRAARDAWAAAREPLQSAWLFHFGPAMDLAIQDYLDYWPARPDTIEASLASAATIDAAWIDTLGAPSRGFPAIEYLLFDPARDDAALVAYLGDAGEGARRCTYLAALAADVESQSARLRDAWEPDRGGYASSFADGGELAMQVSVFYNAVFGATEAIKVRKIGTPQGREAMGVPQPDLAESRFSDRSVEDMLDAMRAVRSVFTGTRGARDGLGLEDAIAELRPDAVPDVLARIDAAIAALETLPRPFDAHLADAIVEPVYQTVVAVVRVMSTDVAALLGVTVTFTDTDGD